MNTTARFGKFSLISLWKPDPTNLIGKGELKHEFNKITFSGKRMISVFYQFLILVIVVFVFDFIFGLNAALAGLAALTFIGLFGKRSHSISIKLDDISRVSTSGSELVFYRKVNGIEQVFSRPKVQDPKGFIRSLAVK